MNEFKMLELAVEQVVMIGMVVALAIGLVFKNDPQHKTLANTLIWVSGSMLVLKVIISLLAFAAIFALLGYVAVNFDDIARGLASIG